jgi:hypothetical protein
MTYTHTITVPLAWDEALQHTREALADQGFGILSEINVRATFEAKLGADAAASVGDYVILGACILPWPAVPSPPSRTWAPCCPAMLWSAAVPMPGKPPSRRSTRRPWCS